MSHSTPGGQYPRVYRLVPAARRMYRWLAVVLVAVAAYGSVRQLVGWTPQATFLAYGAGLVLLAAFIWIASARRVTLHADSITVTTWTGPRTLRREEIRGRRHETLHRYPVTYTILVPVSGREVTLPAPLEEDDQLRSWLRTLPLVER